MKAGTNSLIKQINGKFFHIKFFYSGLDLKANGLKPGEASFNVILLEKTNLSIAIEAKANLPSMSF